MLEVAGVPVDDALLDGWRDRAQRAVLALAWPGNPGRNRMSVVARRHRDGASLALAAPPDQLYTATEINEWALAATLFERDPVRWIGLEAAMIAAAEQATPPPALPPVLDEAAAMTRFARLAAAEAKPDLRALIDAADARELPYLLDDEVLTLGAGHGHADLPVDALPLVADVRWSTLHDIPTALVTGSNGKTTTVRLLAACARTHGWRTGYNCTDGLFLDGTLLAAGDYSGPVGARTVLRDRRVQAAILETARGGILRRGLAVDHAQIAVITNVSSDHFGEYGIHDLDALAEVKLVVARVVAPEGLLVVNADDALLRSKAPATGRPIGWFARDDAHPVLVAYRAAGGATSGVRDGRLRLHYRGTDHDLGEIAAMPLTVDGSAVYNVANLAGAALAAAALEIDPATIASVFARFGSDPGDNPGRLMRFELGGVRILMDYAHNPDGLRGVLEVANHLRGRGRLALLLGQAGNRETTDIERLAVIAAEARPELVVIKETEGYLRGRAPGEVPAIIRAALLGHGLRDAALPVRLSELDAARCALAWARPGDVLVLPVHARVARAEVVALLQRLNRTGWRAGQPLAG